MSDYISASPAFRVKILGMLLFTDWYYRYGSVIDLSYFPTKDEQEVVEKMNWYYDEYQSIPSDDDIEELLGDNPLLDEIYEVSEDDLRYAADVALDFARQQAMKIAILESVDDVKAGQLGKVLVRVEEALAVGQDLLSLGLELVDDADVWMYTEIHGRRYPTGWTDIDRLLGGGTVGGEYGLIMAPTGRGKTSALINIGYALAGLTSAANVLHLTYEMPAHKVLKRYAARVTGQPVPRGSGMNRYAHALQKAARVKLRARLRVIGPEDRTVPGVARIIDNLYSIGFDVGALIADYPDLMEPTVRRNDTRFELADITRGLRNIGVDYDIPVWGATQTRREALYKEVITVSDIAEALEKARVADIVVAMCQTRDEEKLQQGRLFLAKVRDSKSYITVPVNMDLARCTIIQRGRVSV